MYLRLPVVSLSGALQPDNEPMDVTKPLRWAPTLDEMRRPWQDARIEVTYSLTRVPSAEEIRVLLGPLAPRFLG